MQIALNKYLLADDGVMSPIGLRVSAVRKNEVAEFLRAEDVEVFDRGNQIVSMSWSVIRQFDTIEECELFLIDEAANAPRLGTLTITAQSTGGRRVVDGAHLASIEAVQQGCSSIHTYQIIGPAPILRIKS